MQSDERPGPGRRPGRRGSRPGRTPGGRGGRERRGAPQRPGGWRGGPAVLSSSRPTASARRQRTRAAEGSLGPAAAPARPGLSNFPLGEAGRGQWGSPPPPPPPLEAAGGGGMVHWGSKGLTILLGGRRLAREEESVGVQKGSRRKRRRRRRPSYAGLGRLRPSGRPRGRGCRLGEGRRCFRARAGRVTGHTGAGGEEEKLRSRFGDRAGGETSRKGKDREEREKGERGPGGSGAAA